MVQMLARYWWVAVLRGILAVLFGILAFIYPVPTLATLILFFGVWMIVDGIFAIGHALFGKSVVDDWVVQLLFGILSLVLGIMVLSAPGVTAFVLVIYAAVWFLIRGIGEIAFAIKLRKVMTNEWLLVLSGMLSVIVAIMLLWNPISGALALMWLIGGYAITLGIVSVAFGIKMKMLGKQIAKV